MITENFWRIFWRDNWRSIIVAVENFRLKMRCRIHFWQKSTFSWLCFTLIQKCGHSKGGGLKAAKDVFSFVTISRSVICGLLFQVSKNTFFNVESSLFFLFLWSATVNLKKTFLSHSAIKMSSYLGLGLRLGLGTYRVKCWDFDLKKDFQVINFHNYLTLSYVM